MHDQKKFDPTCVMVFAPSRPGSASNRSRGPFADTYEGGRPVDPDTALEVRGSATIPAVGSALEAVKPIGEFGLKLILGYTADPATAACTFYAQIFLYSFMSAFSNP